MATKDQRKETRDEREFPATSRQRTAGGFEGVFKHDFARGAQTVTVSKVQKFFGRFRQALRQAQD